MSAAAVAMTPMRDRIRAFIERLLPWFDPAAREREHRATRRVVDVAEATIAERNPDRIRRGYGAYDARFRH